MTKLLLWITGCLVIATSSVLAQSDSLYVTTSDNVKLFVKRAGSGTPMLFIHGGPGSNSFYFEKEGGAVFEKSSTMIYVDQRGCGRSDIPANGDYSLARVCKDFEEIRLALKIRKWNVMAHSFGGIMATEYAVEYPDGINTLVYLNCTISIMDSAKEVIDKTLEILPELTETEVGVLKNESIPVIERFSTAFNFLIKYNKKYRLQYEHKENEERDSRLMDSPFLKWDMGQHILQIPEYLNSFSAKSKLIKKPVLIISGTKDYAVGPDHPKLMQFPNQQLIHINGAHALYAEHTNELYQKVVPFLKKHKSNNR